MCGKKKNKIKKLKVIKDLDVISKEEFKSKGLNFFGHLVKSSLTNHV